MDWQQWQQEFESVPGQVHLNHAGVSPVSKRVVRTVRQFIGDAATAVPDTMREWEWRAEEARDAFARLVGADGDEIAFVKNTSEGLSLIAAGLAWRDGDNILVVDGEYPSNVYPWWGLRDFGVETRMITPRNGVVDVDDIRAAADDRTRMVAISFVDWNSGGRTDLSPIGEWCRSQQVYFCVDGIQGVGAVPIDVERCAIDFLAVGGHKWLLAPEGVGCLYVSRRVVDRVRTVLLGWKSVTDSDTYLPYHFNLRPNASKFESGTAPLLGTVALGAALQLVHEVGIAAIEARLLELTDHLAELVRSRGGEILSPWGEGQRSGIAIVKPPGDIGRIYLRLRKEGFVLRQRGGGIRVAPHYYTSENQLGALVDAMFRRLD